MVFRKQNFRFRREVSSVRRLMASGDQKQFLQNFTPFPPEILKLFTFGDIAGQRFNLLVPAYRVPCNDLIDGLPCFNWTLNGLLILIYIFYKKCTSVANFDCLILCQILTGRPDHTYHFSIF